MAKAKRTRIIRGGAKATDDKQMPLDPDDGNLPENRYPAEVKRAGKEALNAILARVEASSQESKAKDRAGEVMAKHDLTEIVLSNGGKLVLVKPDVEAKITYVAPPKPKKAKPEENGEDE